jgi:beta-galactosidase
MIWVYSNCPEAELFVNDKSYGVKKRNSQDFPAAGLRWQLPLHKGNYHVKVVARNGKATITDEASFTYQTDQWGQPASMLLEKTITGDTAVIKVKLLDARGIPCLDAASYVIFSIAGCGMLIDDQGTAGGSRKVQLANGQAQISVQLNNGKSVLGATLKGIPTAFISL